MDTVEGLQAAVVALTGASAVAVDVEHNHTRSYLGHTCLLQLSDGTHGGLSQDENDSGQIPPHFASINASTVLKEV